MPANVPTYEEFQALAARVAALETAPPADPPPPPDPDPDPPPVDPPPVVVGETIDSLVEFEELHVHHGNTLTLLPGAELVRHDVPPVDPSHADGGLVVHGHLRAVRTPGQAPIVIRSANPSGHRGHVMIHGTAEIDGVEFRDLGRTTISQLSATNPIGRYALHFHLAGDNGRTSRVENCLIHDTVAPSIWRHGLVIHGTNGLLVRGNTIRNKGGTGIFTEDGTERDNVIEGNEVEYIRNYNGINSHSTVSPRPVERPLYKNDFGFEGAGYWFRGPLNIVRSNVARFCAIGYEFYQDGSPSQFEPVQEFADNLAEDCHDGFQPWFTGTDSNHTHAAAIVGPRQYYDRFTARRCKRGVFGYYTGRCTWRDFVIEGGSTGITMGDYRMWELEIVRPRISGCTWAGLAVGTYINNGLLIDDGEFNNAVDINIGTLWHNGDGRYLPPRRTTIRNCQLNGTTHIRMLHGHDGRPNYVQLDQTFVEGYQRVPGDNFRLYYMQQAPTFIVPQSSADGRTVGCPVAGLTNEQALAQHGVCVAGEIATTTQSRDRIIGLAL